VQIDTKMPAAPASGGTVISVAAGGDLQAAINQARPGDVIELSAGATFTGNFTLPDKGSSTDWIVIRPAIADAMLPAPGERMTPARAASANLPRVVSPNNTSVFQTLAGAHNYRLIGLDVGVPDGLAANTALISFGTDAFGGQTTLATVPHHLILDRMYVHGNATVAIRRCVALNSAYSAVIDSYLSDCHAQGFDAQAIGGWNGPGPFKIVNNFLQASGEIILFGGADPGIPNLIPSDIEVRRNHFTRPLSWKGKWLIKNLFELKNANRVLVEANVMENNWLNGQDGTAILFKSVNQDGKAPWSNTSDVTFRLNLVRNVGGGVSMASNPERFPCVPMSRVAVINNIISNINSADYNGSGRGVLALGNLADLTVTHNTMVGNGGFNSLTLGDSGAVTTRFDYLNNVSGGQTNYGVIGQSAGVGTTSWKTYVSGGTFAGNVLASTGMPESVFPAGNFLPTNVAAIGFADYANGDLHLSSASPYKGKATDGTDPGADVDAVMAATQGVVIP
jgi:hypothetical protein